MSGMKLHLSDEETATFLRELDAIIDGDRHFLSPRIQTLKAIRAKLRPEPAPEPLRRLNIMNRREPGDIGDDEGQLFRPTHDARECGVYPLHLIVWCLPFGEPRLRRASRLRREPNGFAGCRDCRHQVEPATASFRAAEGGTSADPAPKLLTEPSQMASPA
jgi:hypothetical protein